MLKNFKINPERDRLVVDVSFYQANVAGASQLALETGEDEDLLPSWTKFVAHPAKSKGFWTNVLQGLFLGQHGLDELNTDLQFGEYTNRRTRVAMMFLPGNTRKENLLLAADYASEALPGFRIIPVNGSVTSNRKAEKMVKDAIDEMHEDEKNSKPILIIAAQMAQRSFSVPEITELYLAYDNGDTGATIQKMSRALTPGEANKVGKVVSLSFDPNRDDKFDAVILETVMNYKEKKGIQSAKEAMRQVLRTIDIFRFSSEGEAVRVDEDDYLESLSHRDSLSRIVGKIANLSLLSDEDKAALAQGNADYFRNENKAAGPKGKARNKVKGTPRGENDEPEWVKEEKKIEQKAREVIVTIAENIDILILGTDSSSVSEAIEVVANDKEIQREIEHHFGIEFDIIQFLFNQNVIREDILSLKWDK